MADADVLSLAEMCSIRSGVYVKELAQIVHESKAHILDCEVSDGLAKGRRKSAPSGTVLTTLSVKPKP